MNKDVSCCHDFVMVTLVYCNEYYVFQISLVIVNLALSVHC